MIWLDAANSTSMKIYKSKTEATANTVRLALSGLKGFGRWQSYCPRCGLTWVRRNERAGRRSFRRHMALVHGRTDLLRAGDVTMNPTSSDEPSTPECSVAEVAE